MTNNQTTKTANEYGSELLVTVEQIEKIRQVWEKMQAGEPHPVINADIDRYLSVLHASEGDIRPWIVLIKKNGNPCSMLIGRREKSIIPLKFGYKTIFNFRMDCITIVYGGVLGCIEESFGDSIINELKKYMYSERLDVIYFSHLRTDTLFYRSLQKNLSFFSRNHRSVLQPHWRIRIPETIDNFYASRSKKHRKHLKQYQNALERQYPGQVRICAYRNPEEVERAVCDAASISKRTYQSGMGCGFQDDFSKRNILHEAAQKGWFRGFILYINEEPAAFRFALEYRRVFFGDGIGYDPQWKQLRIGTILFIKVLEHLCNEKQMDYYDFGFGDAEYKRSFGNESWEEAAATYIYALRPYPVFVNILETLNSCLTQLLAQLIKKIGIFSWIKRNWRSRLADTTESKSPDE